MQIQFISAGERTEPDPRVINGAPSKRETRPEKLQKVCTMVKRRKEDEFVGVVEFEGRTSEDPEGRAQGAKWGKIRVSRGSTGVRVAFSKAADMALWQARSEQGGKGKRSPRP